MPKELNYKIPKYDPIYSMPNGIKKNKINNTNNICSICLDKCNIIFCNNCYNYVHLKCIKKYISYNNYHINTENNILINCFICKTYINFNLSNI